MAVDLAALLANNQSRPTPISTKPLAEEGDFSRRANAGIVGDLFNLLSRTSHASATAVDYATDKDSNTSLLGGLKEGITGKSKTTYSDVLNKHGVEGPAGAVLGFAGDVLLDPLTYTGIKFNKGISKTAAEIAATRTVGEEGALAVAKEAARLRATDPSHLYVTFGGKKISPKLNLPGTGVTEKVQGTTLARGFSRAAELPLGLAESSRVFEGGSAGKFSSHLRGIKEVFVRNLTPEERVLISHAIETDSPLSNVPLKLSSGESAKAMRGKVAHPEGFTTLEDYRLLAKQQLKDMFTDERDFGLLKDEQFRNNYVPHFYKTPPNDAIPGKLVEIKTGPVGPNKESFMKARKFKGTLAEAESNGWTPVTDVADLLEIRAGKHHRVVGRAAFVQDAVNNFGVKLTKDNRKFLTQQGWYDAEKALAGSPLADKFKGTYLPEPVVKALNTTDKVLREGPVGSEFMKFYDKTMSEWKFLNTAVNPGYHVRNSFTDALMNFADGVVNPKYYAQARRVLADRQVNTSAEILGDGLAHVNEMTSKVNIAGKKVSTKEAWDAYVGSGAKSGFVTTELTRNTNALEKKGLASYIARGKSLVGDASDTREDFFRLAHYLHALDQEVPKSKNFVDASVAAGKRVRKYNIDYGSLSSTEKNYVNRVIPFYSFMRKNLPLQMELLFTKPGFMAGYAKGQNLLQGVLGTQDDNGDYLVPDWIRNSAPVRVALAKQEANSPISKLLAQVAGAKEGEATFLPTVGGLTPLQDVANVLEPINSAISQGPVAGMQEAAGRVVNMATPMIKAPVEMATGRSLYTGGKIDNWQEWLASQVGPTRMGAQAMTGNQNKALTSFLGIPLQVNSQPRQLAELNRRTDGFNQQVTEQVRSNPAYQKYAALLAEKGLPQYLQEQLLASLAGKLVPGDARRTRLQINQENRRLQG